MRFHSASSSAAIGFTSGAARNCRTANAIVAVRTVFRPTRAIAVRSSVICLPDGIERDRVGDAENLGGEHGLGADDSNDAFRLHVLVRQHLLHAQRDVGKPRQLDFAGGELGCERLDEREGLVVRQ